MKSRVPSCSLDVFVVRKLGVPGHEELAMGAIATGRVRVLNEEVTSRIKFPKSVIDEVAGREQQELERREWLYRGDQPSPDVQGRTVILIDDGLATGATMRAAATALRQLQRQRLLSLCRSVLPRLARSFETKSTTSCASRSPSRLWPLAPGIRNFRRPATMRSASCCGKTCITSRTILHCFRDESCKKKRTRMQPADEIVGVLRDSAQPLTGASNDYDALLELIGDARFVLLGEATHGTHEFYREQAQITKRLIAEKGFTAVAVEADWPDAYRVDRYVRGTGMDPADAAFAGFERFPTWMWRNAEVLDFVGWLRPTVTGKKIKKLPRRFHPACERDLKPWPICVA